VTGFNSADALSYICALIIPPGRDLQM